MFSWFLQPGFSNEFRLFGDAREQILYFHAHHADGRELLAAGLLNLIFEIDLAWAHSSFNAYVEKGTAYIGHPEEFYTLMGRPFPVGNVSLQEFQAFCAKHPLMKVLIDVKDEAVFPDLEALVQAVGPERCIVHAFIKNWTALPEGVQPEPHWHREDIDLFALDRVLSRLRVPLIANCRGFSDGHVERCGLIAKMCSEAKKCKSVIALGLYYPGAPLPGAAFLKAINKAGYYAWLNGNEKGLQEKAGAVRYIGMMDDLNRCTRF